MKTTTTKLFSTILIIIGFFPEEGGGLNFRINCHRRAIYGFNPTGWLKFRINPFSVPGITGIIEQNLLPVLFIVAFHSNFYIREKKTNYI